MFNKSFIDIKLQIIFFLICSFSYAQTSKLDSAYYYFKTGEKFDSENKHYDAYENYIKARNLYIKTNKKDSIAKCNINLFYLISSQNDLNQDAKHYLDNYTKYAEEKKDSLMLLIANNAYASYFWDISNTSKTRGYYNKSLLLTQKKGFEIYRGTIYSNLAYLYTAKYPDSAKLYFDKTLNSIDKSNKDQLLGTYINYANFFEKQQNYQEAIIQLKKAEAISVPAYQLKYNKIIFGKFANYYSQIKDYKNAYTYYEKYNIANDSLNFTAQNIAISDLDKKYQTAEKEKKILEVETKNFEVETKNKEQKKLITGGLLFLILTGIISFLVLKNSQKKRKLAIQEKEIEKQKNLTLLKEQELGIINAMIEGQEKERKQIAEDLHDNIGSVLATLKLHFENLKLNRKKKEFDQEKLYEKTENLIDETYKKVRNIAHAKNAGVIANVGLLNAVELMSNKISEADKIHIDVVHFGLDKRLENSLEITIFRIIQELITNIIKHSDAKNATINLSLYDDVLNVIIEDDGKGFDPKNIPASNGMGLNSIEKRITHLNGTFEIDSTKNNGTTIIMNIPLEK